MKPDPSIVGHVVILAGKVEIAKLSAIEGNLDDCRAYLMQAENVLDRTIYEVQARLSTQGVAK